MDLQNRNDLAGEARGRKLYRLVMASLRKLPTLPVSTSSTICHLVLFLAFLSLPGCKSYPVTFAGASPEAAFDDSWTEKLTTHIPKQWAVGFAAHSDNMRLSELVLAGQTVDHWTDMITILILAKKDGQTLDSVLLQATEAAALTCEAPLRHVILKRFVDAGFPAVFQLMSCKKTKKSGFAEAYVEKVIEARNGFFHV